MTVTLRTPSLQGFRNAVTTVNGHWVVPNLPPGEYGVELNLDGFEDGDKGRRAPGNGAAAGRGRHHERGGRLGGGSVVTAEGEQVSRTSQAATTLTAATVNALPVSRTIESVVLLAPGVNANGPIGAVTISGGESYENSWNVDGIQAQDSWRATLEPVYIEDAVAEITTLTSGISAEHGRFSGRHGKRPDEVGLWVPPTIIGP